MPFYNEEGEEIKDLHTKEELEAVAAKLKEAEEKAKIAEAERAELETLRKKDLNFSKLRKQVEEKRADAGGGDGQQPPKKEETPAPKTDDVASKLFQELNVTDDNMKSKAKYYFDKLAAGTTDPAILKMHMESSLMLAKNPHQPNMSPPPSGGGSRGGGGGNENANNREMASVFGLGDEDVQKYDQKDWKPNYGKKIH